MKYQINIWKKGNLDETVEKVIYCDSWRDVITILNALSDFFNDLRIYEIDIVMQEEKEDE
jgi:hypothetical protein